MLGVLDVLRVICVSERVLDLHGVLSVLGVLHMLHALNVLDVFDMRGVCLLRASKGEGRVRQDKKRTQRGDREDKTGHRRHKGGPRGSTDPIVSQMHAICV